MIYNKNKTLNPGVYSDRYKQITRLHSSSAFQVLKCYEEVSSSNWILIWIKMKYRGYSIYLGYIDICCNVVCGPLASLGCGKNATWLFPDLRVLFFSTQKPGYKGKEWRGPGLALVGVGHSYGVSLELGSFSGQPQPWHGHLFADPRSFQHKK